MIRRRSNTFLQGIDGNEERNEKNFMERMKKQRSKLISHEPKRHQLYYIFHLILNQRRFTYSTCLAIMYFFRCRNCRSRKHLKRTKSAEKDFKLDKGRDKLYRDLDIVNLLEMIKDYHVMK